MAGLLALALAQPRERIADGVDRGADGLGLRLHQIDIFGVAQRLLEQQLVDGRATAEGDLSGERWRIEQVAECAADDQVLLDLRRVRPRGVRPPGLDVGLGDQSSTSTTSLISSFQVDSRSGTSASAATIGLTPGSRGAKCLAVSA